MRYECPVCGYDQLPSPPADYTICPSCGTEFGVSDVEYTLDELQSEWVRSGYRWHSRVVQRPTHWNPSEQLLRVVPFETVKHTQNIRHDVPDNLFAVIRVLSVSNNKRTFAAL